MWLRSEGNRKKEAALCILVALPCSRAMVLPLTHEALGIGPWIQEEIASKYRTFDAESLELRPRLRNLGLEPMRLGIMESKDVGAVARLLAECFSSVKVTNEYAPLENAALRGVAMLTNVYDVTEYSIGLRVRCSDRIDRPLDAIKADDQGSLVLTVARGGPNPQAVAALELRIRDTDGTAPAALPFLDRLRPENQALATSSFGPRPYISCLCVATSCRRRGIAAALLSVAEHLAGPEVWGYDSVFLHVQASNQAAIQLYENAGYSSIPLRKTHENTLMNSRSVEDIDEDTAKYPLTFLYKPLRTDAPDVDTIARCLNMPSSASSRSIRKTNPLRRSGDFYK